MCSFFFQSTPTTWWPSSFRRLARWLAMKPPAPVTQLGGRRQRAAAAPALLSTHMRSFSSGQYS